MSVQPFNAAGFPGLTGSEGELVSVQVCTEPRLLEEVLEVLASATFPINPQIYHHAGLEFVYADGHRDVTPVTIVEFPAYSQRLSEIRKAFQLSGLPSIRVRSRPMLDELHSVADREPAPAEAPYQSLVVHKTLFDN